MDLTHAIVILYISPFCPWCIYKLNWIELDNFKWYQCIWIIYSLLAIIKNKVRNIEYEIKWKGRGGGVECAPAMKRGRLCRLENFNDPGGAARKAEWKFMVFILDGCSFHYVHKWSKSGISIWLLVFGYVERVVKSDFFISEITYFTSYVRYWATILCKYQNENSILLS